MVGYWTMNHIVYGRVTAPCPRSFGWRTIYPWFDTKPQSSQTCLIIFDVQLDPEAINNIAFNVRITPIAKTP